jgi:hypothetical protein
MILSTRQLAAHMLPGEFNSQVPARRFADRLMPTAESQLTRPAAEGRAADMPLAIVYSERSAHDSISPPV